MKKSSFYIIVAAAVLGAASCKKDLAEINQNPNGATNPQPDYLLTSTEKKIADTYWGVDNNMNSSLLFVQHWAKIQYTDPDRYIFANNAFTPMWNALYAQAITNLNKIISISKQQQNPNYNGVALVLRSWSFLLLTDAFGDIPYSQAGKIDSVPNPAYDAQRTVYLGLLNDLKTAQASLSTSGAAIAGDVLYNNQIGPWKKFANSLRLRIALRIADREPQIAAQTLADIASEGSGYISSNTETAQLVYQDSPNQNPISNLFDTRDDYRISQTVTDKLRALNDPRLPIYAAPTADPTPLTYVGIPNGLTPGDASNLGFTKTSKPGTYFRAPHAPAVIISYAEVLFGRAEAAARGLTGENAADLYKQAITASFNQYGIQDATTIKNYTDQPAVTFNAGNYKQSIGDQKWIALFGQGLESYAEWRRLDYPQLKPAVAGVLNGALPVRFIYPGSEQTLNGNSYTNAVKNQGADLLTTKLWFDAN
ncbi:SusD/RagB family nutrient-binding outer membrane lipoprotein [Deminuibacter soli]|uniref:SusD/RagB family nutrient-binding outer membrane lipoprotein n=1 Tax=Deminuibacter soli TaxID=2291815 RepID=A0A3E1NCU7_9BACT|nr:SusD/RagB family nutrient-binding outer membrane lipoprotein [Deminuibacter soli]RFM25682.1 SusD/RagB family nutrient-binding outer membrane lipoprotein [Deminuibacter soli]